MRIGFDAKRAFQNSTGLGNYSRDVIRLFTHNRPDDEFFLFDPKGSGINFDYNKFNTHIISSQWKSGIGKALWRSFGLKRQVNHLHLDIYHGLSNELPVGIDKTGAKTLVTIHDLIFEKHPEWYPGIDRKIYRKKVKQAIKMADTVVAISQQTRRDLIEEYNIDVQKVRVVYQGCAPIFSNRLSPEELNSNLMGFELPEEFILYVGTIEERKNLHRLVQALADTQIPLVVVGRKTNYYKKVEEALEGSYLQNNFFHLQGVSELQLASLYQKAKLFVYPSLYEGFGIPVIEALSSGTAVITGKGCLKEAAGGGGLSVDVTNVDKLKSAILKLWSTDDLREEMVVAGTLHVKKFSDENIWKKWTEVYKGLAKKRIQL